MSSLTFPLFASRTTIQHACTALTVLSDFISSKPIHPTINHQPKSDGSSYIGTSAACRHGGWEGVLLFETGHALKTLNSAHISFHSSRASSILPHSLNTVVKAGFSKDNTIDAVLNRRARDPKERERMVSLACLSASSFLPLSPLLSHAFSVITCLCLLLWQPALQFL